VSYVRPSMMDMYSNKCTFVLCTSWHSSNNDGSRGPPLHSDLPENTLMFGILVAITGFGLSETLMTLNPTFWLGESVITKRIRVLWKSFYNVENGSIKLIFRSKLRTGLTSLAYTHNTHARRTRKAGTVRKKV
jgi:hypothetical protein